jgi:PTH1 family peptidyl-tRNA hydrolase
MDVASYVLQNFSEEEQKHLHDFLATAGDAMESLIFDGYQKAATKFTRGPLACEMNSEDKKA